MPTPRRVDELAENLLRASRHEADRKIALIKARHNPDTDAGTLHRLRLEYRRAAQASRAATANLEAVCVAERKQVLRGRW